MPRGCGRRHWFEACKGSLERMFPESAAFQRRAVPAPTKGAWSVPVAAVPRADEGATQVHWVHD